MEYPNSFNRQMQIPANTYDVNIVHQDDPNIVYGNIEKRLIIDSRDRNYQNYPNPSNYIIKLNEQFRNITSIELTRAQIPQSGYIINKNNNILHVVYDEECYAIEITVGDYNITELCTEIETQLLNTLGVIFTVTSVQSKITIKETIGNNFSLNFKGSVHLDNTHSGFKRLYPPNSIGKLLGFLPKNYSGNSEYTAENKYDLFYNRYLILYIEELERLRSKETSVMDSFAILPLNDEPNSLINVDACKYPTSKEIKYFTPPLGKLDKLTIKFLTYDGYEYDFNGLEHYLDLRINMLNQQGKYLNM